MTLALCTTDDLRARLQDPSLDEAVARAAVDAASGLVRSLSDQTLDFVQGDVVELTGGDRILTLPQRPVVVDAQNPLTVEQLTISSAGWMTVEGQGWYREGDQLIRRWPTQWVPQMGISRLFEASKLWGPLVPPGAWAPRVRVTYSHGFRAPWELPPGLNPIVVSLAAQFAVNPQMLREEKVGGVDLTYGLESMRSHADVMDALKKELRAVRLRRGGAFSVGSS